MEQRSAGAIVATVVVGLACNGAYGAMKAGVERFAARFELTGAHVRIKDNRRK